jgi:hypothetical protein
MKNRPLASFRSYLIASLILLLTGWGIFSYALFMLKPVVGARWLLFFGETLGLTALALPAAWFLNLRFPSDPPAGEGVIVRQAIWLGIYGTLITWLQQERLVNLITAVGLAGGLAAIEYLIRMRERAKWQPAIPLKKVVVEEDPFEDGQPEE